MYTRLALLLLLCLSPFVVDGFRERFTFGPHVYPKRLEKKVLGSDNGNAISIDTVDKSCGDEDGIEITSYYLGPRTSSKVIEWQSSNPCLSSASFITSSQYNNEAYYAIQSNNGTFVYQANSTGVFNVYTFPPSFSLTNLGLFGYKDEIFVHNEETIENTDGSFNYNVPTYPSTKIKKVTSDQDYIYIAGHFSGKNFFVSKINKGISGALTFSNYTTTMSSAKVYGSDYSFNSLSFYQRDGLIKCGNSLILILVSSTKLEIRNFDTNLVQGPLEINYSISLETSILDVTCNPVSKEVLILRDIVVLDVIPVKYYFLDRYDISGSLIETFNLTTLDTGEEETVPPYVAVISNPTGSVYVHRQVRLTFGPNTEVYGTVYSSCNSSQFGSTCQPCTCSRGNCDWGELGSGLCTSCETNRMAGLNCELNCNCLFSTTPCNNGVAGNGECYCDLPAAKNFNCSSCDNGYFLDPSNICSICPIRFYCVEAAKIPCEFNDVQGLSFCKPPPVTGAPTSAPTDVGEPSPTSSGGENQNRDLIPIIVGSVFGGLVLLIILVFLVVYCFFIKKKRSPAPMFVSSQPNELSTIR